MITNVTIFIAYITRLYENRNHTMKLENVIIGNF